MNFHLHPRDQELLSKAVVLREGRQRPRLGDYVLFPTGQLERLSNEVSNRMQTSPGGSFQLLLGGREVYSGALNPSIPEAGLERTEAELPGAFWFFHLGISGPGRGVQLNVPCRVYKTQASYKGHPGLRTPKVQALQEALDQQLSCAV